MLEEPTINGLKKNCLVRFNCHSIDPGKCISLKPPGDGWKMSFRRSATGSRYEDIRRLTIESEINTNHGSGEEKFFEHHEQIEVQQDQSRLFFWSLMRFRKKTIKLKPISQKDKPYPKMFLRAATNTKT